MEALCCEQKAAKVSLAEVLRCFEHPISEEQAWAVCFQCCCKMKQLAQGLYPSLHSVFIKGPGSIFIHADGTASFRVYHKSDVGNIQQSEDKLLEYLGVVIYEALDWGIDSQVERELSDPLEKLLCLMLKLDDEAMKPVVTLQDVIKSLRKMDVEDLLETPLQKKEKQWAPLWPSVICELQGGVRLHKATERPQRPAPLKERALSPYELLLDDIQHKRYNLRKVTIEQKRRTPSDDVAAPKPHLKPVLQRKLKECVPQESRWHEQLLAEIKRPQTLQPSTARESGARPKEMPVMPKITLRSPSDRFLTFQDASTEFKTVNAIAQQLEPEVREPTPKLSSSTHLASARSSAVSCKSTGLTADRTCPSVSAPMLAGIKSDCSLNIGQQQLPPYRARSKSLESGLQSKELDCHLPSTWPSPTIAELIGTRYATRMLEGEGQGGSDGASSRGKICFSCRKQMFLKWPYSCYLCSSVVCCDCCIKMSVPFRMCVHLPLHFLKLVRLSREEDPATQERKNSELLHEVEHWECSSVPVILEPHCLARPLCCYSRTMADWLTADICTQCEHYLLNVASNQQQNIPLRRISQSWTKLE
ncbi:protein spire homolog 1-like isoform X2 [Cygnus olor]|uniref:protein spire homolog 1-like isoform X2 n=1 Tax=Cygnus olor TaxID=8869 RepID=UPI001ADE339A|nr:protein spire homolog 1-like isoform X2 [Cygnus olor]